MGGVLIELKDWKWLKNNGVMLEYESKTGIKAKHFVPPGGVVSIPEAAKILATNEVQLHRLKKAGRLKTEKRRGRTAVPVGELLRLKASPGQIRPGRSR
jgi:hypothetical protein